MARETQVETDERQVAEEPKAEATEPAGDRTQAKSGPEPKEANRKG